MGTRPTIALEIPVILGRKSTLHIETASLEDFAYVEKNAHRWRRNVGWIPRSGLAAAIARNVIWNLRVEDQPIGHLLFSGGERQPFVLRHNCVEEEFWNNGVGTVATQVFLAYAKAAAGFTTASVRTRDDLLAQTLINVRCGGKVGKIDRNKSTANGRQIVTWLWSLRQRVKHVAPRETIILPGKDRMALGTMNGEATLAPGNRE